MIDCLKEMGVVESNLHLAESQTIVLIYLMMTNKGTCIALSYDLMLTQQPRHKTSNVQICCFLSDSSLTNFEALLVYVPILELLQKQARGYVYARISLAPSAPKVLIHMA